MAHLLDSDLILQKIVLLVGLKDSLEMSLVNKSLACRVPLLLTSSLKLWIYGLLDKKLGHQFRQQLFLELHSENVESFLFCGGIILQMMTHSFPDLSGDVDIYLVPNFDISFVYSLRRNTTMNYTIDWVPNERTPQNLHDVKVSCSELDKYELDIVFRKEVYFCANVDCRACKSGLLFQNGKYTSRFYDYMKIRERLLPVYPFMSELRRMKMASKGFILQILDN